LDAHERDYIEPHREELRHRLRQLFGDAKPGEMHVFKVSFISVSLGVNGNYENCSFLQNTHSTNTALWRVKNLIEIRPITFPHGEPTLKDVGTMELFHDGRCLLRTEEPDPGDVETLVDKKKQFTPSYLASRLMSRDLRFKDVFEDTVYSP